MFRSLLRQFLKKAVTIVAGAGTLLFISTAGTSTLLFVGSMTTSFDVNADSHDDVFRIKKAEWSSRRNRLTVEGEDADSRVLVTVTNADTTAFVDDDESSRKGKWRTRTSYDNTSSVPCRVRAQQPNGDWDERDVSRAPADCDDGGGGNTPPTANDDAATTNQDVPVTINVLANDTDPDVGDTLSVASVTQGGNGSVTNNGTDVTYTPNAGWFGIDTFTYIATDGTDPSNSATVTVTVNQTGGGNNPPTAVDQTFPIDTAVLDRAGPDLILGNAEVPAPGVLLNAADPDGDTLTAVLVSGASAGSLILNPDGSFEYTPASSPSTDSFTYQADDGKVG